jgi:glycerol-3-phosphate acyltransferase PlsY
MNDAITLLEGKPMILALICSISGYLIGSVSFARVIYFMVTKKSKIESFAEPVPHSGETFESDLVSATLISKKIGVRYGCMTSVADMLKVALPTLIAKLLFTSEPYFLIVALFGVIGHNFSVYHGFTGGRGESAILGILLVINWFGLLLANAVSLILGFITGSVLVVRWGGYVILIFWLWYYFKDWRYVLFMILINFFFWFSMRKDLARFLELKKKKGLAFTEEEVSEFIMMGKGIGRTLDRYSLYALYKKLKNRNMRQGSK